MAERGKSCIGCHLALADRRFKRRQLPILPCPYRAHNPARNPWQIELHEGPESPPEPSRLVRLHAELRAGLQSAPGEVEALLAVGDRPPDHALDATELATCALIAGTLFAHDATVTRR